jgi:site-specific DNA recombinase
MKPRKVPQNRDRVTIGYVRVSSDDQAEKGVSLDAQETRIAAYAAALGLELGEIVRDAGASAKSLQRPGMVRILAGVQEGRVGRVIALKLDRITRSTRDLADW